MRAFVQSEQLEGNNSYFCEKCGHLVRAVKREFIKKLPNVLIISLKRFDINYNDWTRYKINDYCEFPFEINMKEYT